MKDKKQEDTPTPVATFDEWAKTMNVDASVASVLCGWWRDPAAKISQATFEYGIKRSLDVTAS